MTEKSGMFYCRIAKPTKVVESAKECHEGQLIMYSAPFCHCFSKPAFYSYVSYGEACNDILNDLFKNANQFRRFCSIETRINE
jgi:hypothetical protein